MAQDTPTVEAAQAAMNAAMAQKRAALEAYNITLNDALNLRKAVNDSAAKVFDSDIAAAMAIRNAALEVARKAEVEANKLVRKASVAEAKAAAEAKLAEAWRTGCIRGRGLHTDPDGLEDINP